MSRRKAAAARAAARGGTRAPNEQLVQRSNGAWWVRPITGVTSFKDYRCPGCEQVIRPATPHVVVWPQEPHSLFSRDALEERRHWHAACWNRNS